MGKNDDLLGALAQAISDGDEEAAVTAAQAALDAGLAPAMLFGDCIMPVLQDVGDKFSALEIFLPEMVLAADAAKAVIALLDPILKATKVDGPVASKVVICTIAGDVHDIGKNMVATMLEISGFEVTDLGTDVAVADLLATARDRDADIIAMSSLLTTSLPYMNDTLAMLVETGDRDRFKVMVGGGPVTPGWASEAGADGYGADAAEAVEVARRLVAGSKQGD